MGFIYCSPPSQVALRDSKPSPRPAIARVSWCLETSSIKTPFPGWISVLSSFVSLFSFYILSYLLSKTMGCFSGRLMTSASNEKLFCEVCSVFSYSFDEFVGERVVSPSQSSTVLAPPPVLYYSCLWFYQCNAGHIEFSRKLSFFLNFQKEFVQSCHFSSLY